MSEDRKFDEYLEHRAEELGLPTDPEAYQDGGLAEAAVSPVLSEAETLVALLRANGVPAWIKAPLATLAVAEPVIFTVLVPMGRLADAESLLAEHETTHIQESVEENAEEITDEQAAADDRQADEAAAEDQGDKSPGLRGRDIAAAFLLGLAVLALMILLLAPLIYLAYFTLSIALPVLVIWLLIRLFSGRPIRFRRQ